MDETVENDMYFGEILEEITLHDADNASQIKDIRQTLKSIMIRSLHTARSQVRRLTVEARPRAKKNNPNAGGITRMKGRAGHLTRKPTRETRRLVLRSVSRKDTTPPGRSLHQVGHVARKDKAYTPQTADTINLGAAGSASSSSSLTVSSSSKAATNAVVPETKAVDQRAPRAPSIKVYSTLELLKSLRPVWGSIGIDVLACRFRAKFNGEVLPAVGFGPCCMRNRSTASEAVLADSWSRHSGPRPASAFVDAIPHEA